MPSGTVIEYRGKRGLVFRIKYVDADGRQVMETVGRERDGWTRKKAQAELRERLVRVERRGYRRPRRLTFAAYADTWFEEGKTRRGWKPRTVLAFGTVLGHLKDELGPMPLNAIRPRDVAGYTREALERFAPKTVQLHLNVLHDLFKTARAEELVESNPVEGAERPKIPPRRWRILEPTEIRRVLSAFTDAQAQAIFLTLMLTGLRRFELQALRWRDIDLLEGVLRVGESKSEEGVRSIALSSALVDELERQFQRSAFKGNDELVFCHPKRGSKIDHEWYAGQFRAALKAAGISDHIRPFHDARHASLTNGAAAGESPIALMTRAGHRSMQTTKVYLHLAGTVFPDEAAALEQRLLGGAPASVELGAELSEGFVGEGHARGIAAAELRVGELTRPGEAETSGKACSKSCLNLAATDRWRVTEGDSRLQGADQVDHLGQPGSPPFPNGEAHTDDADQRGNDGSDGSDRGHVGRKFYQPEQTSPDLSASETATEAES